MYKIVIILLLLWPVTMSAQRASTAGNVDSTTYQLYLAGDWPRLIETAGQALANNIDFKYLRQRMGYAFYSMGDYYASQKQYEAALKFDPLDAGTREFLYYCALNTGNEVSARYHSGKLPSATKKRLNIHPINPVSSVELEYNYKANNYGSRSNPTYFRGGITTQLGFRTTLYQSASNYKQTIDTSLVKQPDYLALMNFSITSNTSLSLAYHHLNTSIDGYKYPGNLYYGALSTRINRYVFGLNGSHFKYGLGEFTQLGVHTGVTVPGKSGIYFHSYLNTLIESTKSHLIFTQEVGTRIYKSLWGQALLVLGNIQNYTDHNALYVYNSLDPTIFRTGFSLYWYTNGHISLYINYLYDKKQIEQTTGKYTQQSYLGGIIWKL